MVVAARNKPGVEVIQQIAAAGVSAVRPQLVPCNVAPFFEVLELLNEDNTLNADSQFSSLYRQLAITIPQSSFPNPRGNIGELNILEETIRAFFIDNGAPRELQRDNGFLVGLNYATQPSIEATQTGPFNLDGLQLVIQFNRHTAVGTGLPAAGSLSAADNITVTFVGTALSVTEVADQINAVVPGVALDSPANPGQLLLRSTRYGAGASVVVRSAGSANSVLGFPVTPTADQIAVGAGLYVVDDGDGDSTSPRIEFFGGTTQRAISGANTGAVTGPDFVALSVRPGDILNVQGASLGEIDQVTTGRLTLRVEQPLFSQVDTRNEWRYAWVQGENLSYPASSSTAASITGAITALVGRTAVAAVPFIVPATAFSAVGAGETFSVDVTEAGVALGTEVINSGAGWANIAAAVAGINGAATNFEAYPSNEYGNEVAAANATHVSLRALATNTGSAAALNLTAQTAGMLLFGFSQTLPVSDVGENIRFRPGTEAVAIAGTAWTGLAGATSANDVVYTPTVLGTARPAETITWSGNHANNAGGLATAIADWNSQAIYTEAYEANAAGIETAGGGYFAVRTMGENVGATAIINVTGGTDAALVGGVANNTGTDTILAGSQFNWTLDGNPQVHSVVFVSDEDDGGVSLQAVIDSINGVTPGVASSSSSSPPALTLTSTIVGEASQVGIGTATATVNLGLTPSATSTGNGRPNPDFAVDISGNAVIQAQQLRDPRTGVPFPGVTAPLHFAYRALRLDLSPRADNPGLVTFSGTDELLSLASPISVDNPGALMTFLTLQNCPGVAVSALGVPDISADAPTGTTIGYAECFEFLESEEVYGLALGTQDPLVHQAGIAHANFMSGSNQKGERIVVANQAQPSRALPTVLGSGTDANLSGSLIVLTDGNVAAALVGQGIDPTNVNPTSGAIVNEVYLDLSTDDERYLVVSVANGNEVTLRTSFTSSEDTEVFFARAAPTTVISASWSLEIRGAALTIPGSTDPDKNAIAQAVGGTAQAYGDRRFFLTFPGECVIAPTGLNQRVPGYYATAAIIGMIAGQPPQQPFTNVPIAGLVAVPGSNDTFSEQQLNVMDGGGAYVLQQEIRPNGPVTCRHQTSTDTSSIARMELSVTKVVDYAAKFFRTGLRQFIGRRNITPAYLDELGTVMDGLIAFLEGANIILGGEVQSIDVDPNSSDTVLVVVLLDTPKPSNYIRLTLVVN